MKTLFVIQFVCLLCAVAAQAKGGTVQMMLLKALKHVRTVPIILSVPSRQSKKFKEESSEIIKVKKPVQEKELDYSDDSHELRNTKKLVKKSKGAPKVKYVYVRSKPPKKYHKHQKYHDYDVSASVRKQVLYEDKDHQFIRISSPPKPKPKPKFSHVRVIHIDETYGKNCPYISNLAHKKPEYVKLEPHHETKHAPTYVTAHKLEYHQPQIKYETQKIRYEEPKIHYHEPKIHYETPKIQYESPKVQYQHEAIQYEEPQVHYQQEEKVEYTQDHGVQYQDLGDRSPTLHIDHDSHQNEIQHVPSVYSYNQDEKYTTVLKQQQQSEEHSSQTGHHEQASSQYMYDSGHHVPVIRQSGHQGVFEAVSTDPLHAESMMIAKVMNEWPEKEAIVISDFKGQPLLFAPAKKGPLTIRSHFNGVAAASSAAASPNFLQLL